MMVDLRVKVMGLLDDPGLEAVKVTWICRFGQYYLAYTWLIYLVS